MHRARASGAGVRVAILDTGIDAAHPDFRNRRVHARSFLESGDTWDDNGHGTLCAGIACGPYRPEAGPRYGVACEAELYVAKVLDRVADGTDGAIIAAIEWALEHECAVASLSVGSVCSPDEPYAALYEAVAARALAAGLVLVAPAGNHSQRPRYVAPLDSPANCPSILAVGAVGPDLAVANFSNGGTALDLVAPGVAVHASARTPQCYALSGGTSVAAPFVAGVAALHAQADPGVRGARLRSRLRQSARLLSGRREDVGSGLANCGA
ncbi:MAG: S8 family serine peptidase [Proteobacteria bacterium]|nr:S8 family serine peptidase [Pseudomonadota bacterium]